MAAGIYNMRLLWRSYTETLDDNSGELVITHTDNGYLWCSVVENNGRELTEAGAKITGADCEIRCRNYPPIDVKDLLVDEYYEQTYRINSIYQGDNEMILDCYYHNHPIHDAESSS